MIVTCLETCFKSMYVCVMLQYVAILSNMNVQHLLEYDNMCIIV